MLLAARTCGGRLIPVLVVRRLRVLSPELAKKMRKKSGRGFVRPPSTATAKAPAPPKLYVSSLPNRSARCLSSDWTSSITRTEPRTGSEYLIRLTSNGAQMGTLRELGL